jgi:Pentapeptide repeats (8 copies)
MAKQEHLEVLKQGAEVWNIWRQEHPDLEIDLSNGDFSHKDLSKMNLQAINLQKANLSRTNLCRTNLSYANLRETNFYRADLSHANLQGANLREDDLRWAILSGADLRRADITGCQIYAISAWNVKLERTEQANLIITNRDEPTITVDNLEVAQFIYLILNNQKIRQIIDTITSKVVLILGRFTPERKDVLDILKNELRHYDFVPVVFDFKGPDNRDVLETIGTLMRMSRLIIADITDALVIREELMENIPHLAIPLQPLLHIEAEEYPTFKHIKRHPWVLPTFYYHDIPHLLASFHDHIIEPTEDMLLRKSVREDRIKEQDKEIQRLKEKIRTLEDKKKPV